MKNITNYLRYDWPVFFLLLFTNWLPDNVIFSRFRGWLITPFVGSCAGGLRVARNVVIQNPSQVHLGRNIYLGHGSCLLAAEEITIKDSVLIGPYCVIVSADHTRVEGSYNNSTITGQPILLSENCWLGAHVIVTAGSTLQKGTCVGAGAVVRGAFDQSGLVGGVPAKMIRLYDQANEE